MNLTSNFSLSIIEDWFLTSPSLSAEKVRMFISTMITTDITLGQLNDISPGIPRSSEDDMVKFLQFRATASLGNDEVEF